SMEIEIDGEQQRVTIDEARDALEGVSDEDLQRAMGQRLYERITNERKPLNDWTIEDLEQTLETVANLRTEGRAILAAKQEQKQIIAQNYQDSIIRSLIATGKYTSQPWVGTKEEQKEKTRPVNVARAFRYGTLAMRPKAMMMDNGTEGTAYKLLVSMKRAAQNVEWRAIEHRMEPVFKVIKEAGITEKDLYKTEFFRFGEITKEYSYSAMMYAWLSQNDESNRNAIAYGNLISKEDKIALNHDNELIKELGDARYRQLLNQVQYYLETQDESSGFMAVVKAVQEDFNSQADRLNEVAVREFNKAMRKVEQYLPIHRKESSGSDMRQQVAEDLFNAKAGANATGVAKGFTKDRIYISPDHQTPVNLDLMGVWNKSARQQEHFIAFAEYGRTLNRVFKNLGSRDLENAINRTLGKEMYQDVTEYINQIINPQPNNNLEGLEKGVKFMRGNLGAAYLTWKMGGLVLQAITSPMPYLGYIRADRLIKSYFDIFAHPIA
ncbi:MAG TPA: hypothetical protein VJ869_01050, partial [Sphaerochaeta sp.]|nr:hypothetical protein [Sphaerochaeta sp.]